VSTALDVEVQVFSFSSESSLLTVAQEEIAFWKREKFGMSVPTAFPHLSGRGRRYRAHGPSGHKEVTQWWGRKLPGQTMLTQPRLGKRPAHLRPMVLTSPGREDGPANTFQESSSFPWSPRNGLVVFLVDLLLHTAVSCLWSEWC
jgi:hypothetical protein